MDKKEYKKALEIAEQKVSTESKHNKLISLAVRTEDLEFGGLLRDYARLLGRFPKKSIQMGITDLTTLRQEAGAARDKLINYARFMLLSEKPQWQILAERNGWGPLPKKQTEEVQNPTAKQIEESCTYLEDVVFDGIGPDGCEHFSAYDVAAEKGVGLRLVNGRIDADYGNGWESIAFL